MKSFLITLPAKASSYQIHSNEDVDCGGAGKPETRDDDLIKVCSANGHHQRATPRTRAKAAASTTTATTQKTTAAAHTAAHYPRVLQH